jgi:hypothetical protein
MTARGHIAGLCAAATLSLALVPAALAAPAGDEYLPKVPESGAQSSGDGQSQDSTTTLPTGGTSDETGSESTATEEKSKQDKDESEQVTPIGAAGDSDGGDSSGSVLLNPIVLLMIAAVIAAAVGMTLRRRQAVAGEAGARGAPASGSGARKQSGPRTPDGEIVARRDRPA